MEFIGKIILPLIFSFCVFSCKTVTPVALLEIKPMPREVVIQKKLEYEPIFSVMKILEISEINGVQKYIIAKLEADSGEIKVDSMGEIAADNSFGNVLGTVKVLSMGGGFLRGAIETSTHKIPAGSYIRVQIGQTAKEEE